MTTDPKKRLIQLRYRITKAIALIHNIKVLEGIAARAEADLEIIQGKKGDRIKSRAKRKPQEITASETIWSD